MVRTGKGGRYRYYACSSNRLKGKAACSKPVAIRKSHLDEMILTALSGSLFTPERLPVLLQEAREHQRPTSNNIQLRLSALRKRLRELEAEANRMYAALWQGMVPNSDLFQAQLRDVERDRADCIRHLSRMETESPQLRQTLSKQQATSLAHALQRRLLDAPKALRRRYVQGLVSEIIVDREKAIVTGPRSAIAAAVRAGSSTGKFAVLYVRPETWVTERTGHMGNTFRFRAGGVDAVESEFGRGGASSFRSPCSGGRSPDGPVPGVRERRPFRRQCAHSSVCAVSRKSVIDIWKRNACVS